MAGLTEVAVNFGPESSLVGVWAAPEANGTWGGEPRGTGQAFDLCVVFLNAGVIHHVGPNRIHVTLARALVRNGIPSLRLDLPGIGDSRGGNNGGASVLAERDAAIACALDLLEARTEARRFVLFGLCSGADVSFRTACQDQRVVGVCLVDPARLFPTRRAKLLRILRWLRHPSGWLRLLRGDYQVGQYLRARSARWPGPRAGDVARGSVPRAGNAQERLLAREALRGLVLRGVRICYVVTGAQRHLYNYRRQLLHAFPDLGLERVTWLELFRHAGHTLPDARDRARLEQVLTAWVQETEFPTAERGPAVADGAV